ncbi:Hpt domain-containing protein [Confluentibacter sediminis]|uniref:Hpt domain-containing protein n=1 Tax=Confluentibacter sediminis TaxID=2219045 RepID=UPI000DACD6D2|nr:Hpt domain-containing protein [Confluentibacter sediminis]
MIKQKYQYINLESLKENTFNDIDIQKEIMELFLELIDEYIDTLNKELSNKKWHELFKATHKIKPNINMFGIQSLESVILKLENDFRDERNLDTVDDRVNTTIDIFKKVTLEIETELKLMTND